VGLAEVDFGEHQRFSLKWAGVLTLLMLIAALAVGAITIF